MRTQTGTGSFRKGHWSVEEDIRLIQFVRKYGEGRWSKLAKAAGLQRCGKSCRLRWVNYLRPDIKRGHISEEEERLIINLHSVLGNRWSLIAIHLPGRSDNEIKNYWRSHIKKKLKGMEFLRDNHSSHNHEGDTSSVQSAYSSVQSAYNFCETPQNEESCSITMMDDTSCTLLDAPLATHDLDVANLCNSNICEGGRYTLSSSLSNFNNGLMISEKMVQVDSPSKSSIGNSFQLSQDKIHQLIHLPNSMQAHDSFDGFDKFSTTLEPSTIHLLAKNETVSTCMTKAWEVCSPREIPIQIGHACPNHDQTLSFQEAELSWDVETVQPIVDVHSTPSFIVENAFSFELWDSELFTSIDHMILEKNSQIKTITNV